MPDPTQPSLPLSNEEQDAKIRAVWNCRSFLETYSGWRAYEIIYLGSSAEMEKMLHWPDLQTNLLTEPSLQRFFQELLDRLVHSQTQLDRLEPVWEMTPRFLRNLSVVRYWSERTELEEDPHKHWFFQKLSPKEMTTAFEACTREDPYGGRTYLEGMQNMDCWMEKYLSIEILKGYLEARIEITDTRFSQFPSFDFPLTRARANVFAEQQSLQETLPNPRIKEGKESSFFRKKKL